MIVLRLRLKSER